ncbi:MAG: 1,4-alpha-glucan branching protein GlgB [Deltaproteobacteria bacterium]|nr:1,4-alpha-glucan branching protein GlgB [Deltaproteobacteria bacterium]
MTTLSPSLIDDITHARLRDPFAVLGMHDGDKGLVVRTFQPWASAVKLLDARTAKTIATLERVDDAGVFEAAMPRRKKRFRYRFEITDRAGAPHRVEDPYAFPQLLGDLDVHLLAEGTDLRTYDKMGAHPRTLDGVQGVSFVVWAPNARNVSVIGSFNEWDGRRHPMRLRHESGCWELFIPGLAPGDLYKYEVRGPQGELLPPKSDPYAFYAQRRPETASVVWDLGERAWGDGEWMATREAAQARDQPMAIYEVHLGSWKRRPEDGDRYLTWQELADDLVPYARDMGFTHLELMPINEHPFDGSWGYQPTGLYAPTSRFGTPEQFRDFIERAHAAGLGVLIDWVPGHFPSDAHGLASFDGTHLYEHADPRLGEHQDWGTLIYNFGRSEVRNFLTSNALFWADRYHVDGLRVDAVASMLYLDYSRTEWIPNALGGRENLEAIAFLRTLNEQLYGHFPGTITVAEESTAWPMVSQPTYLGGLGFGYKWNMGWMHDTLKYMAEDPVHRRYHHDKMTFGLIYAFTENFVLPLSHDEVVHGKGSLIGKMPGDAWQKFANLRAYYGFMWTHPGKKLLFMGGEFGQWREWNHDQSLDWHLLDAPEHRGLQTLVRDLNRLYRQRPELHARDCQPEGFEWIDGGDAEHSIYSYLRRGEGERQVAAVVCNFTPVPRHGYRLGLPFSGRWREVLNTDAEVYGGSNTGNGGAVEAADEGWNGRPASAIVTLPPLGTLVLVPDQG